MGALTDDHVSFDIFTTLLLLLLLLWSLSPNSVSVYVKPWYISLDLITYSANVGRMISVQLANKHFNFVLQSQFKSSNVSFDIFTT